MSRYNLLLADNDRYYIDSLGKYIGNSRSNRFKINTFSLKSSLYDFLMNNPDKTDILLIDAGMFSDELRNTGTGITIILSNGRIPDTLSGFPYIDKYQPVEGILQSIMEIYTQSNPDMELMLKGNSRTRLISVFSPCGGSGKTLLSINLSIQLASLGMNTLYLNLESINSTGFFINLQDNAYGLSGLILHLKEDRKNLSAKINAAKTYDGRLNISYVRPADSPLELDDLTDIDICRLLNELKTMGQFDAVVIDIDSVISRRNVAILDKSDCIAMIVLQDAMADHKMKFFDTEMAKLAAAFGHGNISRKTVRIANKQLPSPGCIDIPFPGMATDFAIPWLNTVFQDSGRSRISNPESSLGECLKEIAQKILNIADESMHGGIRPNEC